MTQGPIFIVREKRGDAHVISQPKGGEGRQVEIKVLLGPQVGIQLYTSQRN